MRYGTAFVILALATGPMIGWWPSDETPPRENELSATLSRGMPGPSALQESGITVENSTPAPAVRVSPEKRPVSRSRAVVRSRRPRLPAGAAVARSAESLESRGSAGARTSASASRTQTQTSDPAAGSHFAAATGETDVQAGQQNPTQAPVPESPAPVTTPPAPAPVPVVLTPPVPVDLTPPTHALPYRMIVDAPGLSSTARLEAVEARVRLRLVVRADGSVAVVDVAIPSGRRELDTAARDAARGWRFLPARRDGEPIDSVALIWVSFVASP